MTSPTTFSKFEVRQISPERPWQWLAAGWRDIWRHPLYSLGYGVIFVTLGLLISIGFWQAGLSAFIPVAAGCFALVGPLLAVGLYEISKRLEMGHPFTLKDILVVRTHSPLQLLYIGFVIMFGMLVWSRIAILLYALFVSSTYLPLAKFSEFVLSTPQGLAMIVVGSLIGGGIAFGIFMLTAFSIPLLMDRKMDALEAMVHSVKCITHNPAAMLLWAWLIALLIAVGFASFFIGLVVIFPLLGHATWHAYRDVFPS